MTAAGKALTPRRGQREGVRGDRLDLKIGGRLLNSYARFRPQDGASYVNSERPGVAWLVTCTHSPTPTLEPWIMSYLLSRHSKR